MSSILNLASTRCFRHLPVRSILGYNGLNPSLKLLVVPRINCIMPRIPETEPGFDSRQGPFDIRVPEGFAMIYYLKEQNAVRLASLGATFLGILTVWSIYLYTTEQKDTVANDGETPISTEESASRDSNLSWWGHILTFRIPSPEISESDKIYNFIILPFIITLLLCTRSHVVLSSHRQGRQYITLITRRFGFGSQIVKHGPGEVIYFPQRKIYKHELQGKKVLMFSEYFVNSKEEQLMCTGNDSDFKRGDPKNMEEE